MRLALFAILAACIAAPALAGDMKNAETLDLSVRGSIAEHCALGNIPNMEFGDLERRGLPIETQVAFDCNIPFTMMIVGERGALTHTAMPSGQGPYSGQLPYQIGISMPVRHPASRVLKRSFASRQLVAGGSINSNGGIATDGMTLAVELGQPSGEAGLLAGDYSETIRITVSPL